MRVLITGINGFVGRILKDNLAGQGKEVFGIDLSCTGENNFSLDITDLAAVNDCIHRVRPDFIVHLSAISRVDFDNVGTLYSTNVSGTMNLLYGAARLERQPKFLMVSSSQVYGIVPEKEQPITENTGVRPVNHYGASKAAAENICHAFNREYGIPVVIARPFNHIGRGQSLNFVVPKIIRAFHDGKNELELGNVNVLRDFLDVRDVIDAYNRIMENFQSGEVFNISSGRGIKVIDVIRILENQTGRDMKIVTKNDLLRKNDITCSIGDYSKIGKSLGWEPVHPIEDTIKWIIDEAV